MRRVAFACVTLSTLVAAFDGGLLAIDVQEDFTTGVGSKAICVLEPTRIRDAGAPTDPISGTFEFVLVDIDTVCVTYTINNIAAGSHGFHVHTYGSLHSTNGMATGPHFPGECTSPCRNGSAVTDATQDEVGLLNNGEPLVADDQNRAMGVFNDTLIRLVGTNSIIGRSIVVHGLDPADRIAHCVIGRDSPEHDFFRDPQQQPEPSTFAPDVFNNVDGVTQADCVFSPTPGATEGTGLETGYMRFTQLTPDEDMLVELWVTNLLANGDHQFHVHALGNITGDESAGPHFRGADDFPGMPTPGVNRTRVGQLSPFPDSVSNLGVAANVVVGSDNLRGASWWFMDTHASLTGDNSIVGRAVVLHDQANSVDQIAHCVVGILQEEQPANNDRDTGATPKVLVATAVLRPTTAAASNVTGTVEFRSVPGSDDVVVRYFFTGLTAGAMHGWHVHQWGDMMSADAMATAGHFIGDCAETMCRDDVQEIGSIGDNQMLVANEFGEAYGELIDPVLELNGPNSIVGRSVVVHDDADPAIRVAQGVIGRTVDSMRETAPDQNPISEMICVFQPTEVDDGYDVSGYVRFTRDELDGDITVDYNVAGLSEGAHGWHVHATGNLLSNQDAVSTRGHFVGVPPPVRPAPAADEVGELNNGTDITVGPDGTATGSFVESPGFLDFHGNYSIIGRAVVIHSTAGAPREAYCTIGIASEFALNEPTDAPTDEPGDTDGAVATTFSALVLVLCAAVALIVA